MYSLKTKTKIVAVALSLLFALAVILCALSSPPPPIISFDKSKTYQSVSGFGASSAWIYQAFGLIDDGDLKTDAMQRLYGDEGVRLNTFRYGIGAGGKESDEYWDPLRGAESYFIADRFTGDYSAFNDPSNYDFSRDVGVRALFEEALSLGNIEKVVFFTGSPHYLMTLNGKTHSAEPAQNNLKEECFEAFSNYLILITDWIYKNIICKYNSEIEVSISPVNEPQWDWGGQDSTQEGCHFDADYLARFCDVFYRTLERFNEENGTAYKPDFFESACCKLEYIEDYVEQLAKYDWFKSVKSLSMHSYVTETDIRARKAFYSYLQKFPDIYIKISEYCVMKHGVDLSMDTALYGAKIMLRDFAYLHATDWNWWLSISAGDYEDGLIYWNKDKNGGDVLNVSKRYYAFGQFSKYVNHSKMIKSRMTSLAKGLEQVAFLREDGSVAIVVVNDSDNARELKFKNFKGKVVQITTDMNNDWAETECEYIGSVSVSAKSVNTFILYEDR